MSEKDNRRSIPSGLIALKKIVEGTSGHTGIDFFKSLVKNLSDALDAHGVWVTEYLRDQNRLKSFAFWLDGAYQDTYEYNVPGTPCEPVLKNNEICHVPENVIDLFPDDPDLRPLGAVSYMGLGLRDDNGRIIGHLALLDNKPMAELPEAFAIFKIFASRAEAELKRILYENLLKEKEAKLFRLVNGTMDGIIELDQNYCITQANEAARHLFRLGPQIMANTPIRQYMEPEGYRKLNLGILKLRKLTDHSGSIRIEEQITFLNADHTSFPAETTLSTYQDNGKEFYAIFIRNVEDRVKDQKVIKALSVETNLLRERVNAHSFDEIIGNSPAILDVIRLVEQVAPTNATVLVRGETGTGKELVARAIHKSSKRDKEPIITLNCAALPTELVESELFGHMKGAFTGASANREGRFLLANGGSIFLDEIGELPLSLQAKLLRVLQEGEFEPVGSSKTQKVDVRVIAATNRDLEKEVKDGKFREDLYYRLNVFPIRVPPLRERGNDIIHLAESFMVKLSRRMAVPIQPLRKIDREQLTSYHWPGNVRELQNIIERGILTGEDGYLNLSGLIAHIPAKLATAGTTGKILTEMEQRSLEKENIVRALKAANGRISGINGAAALLAIPPTTLTSRMQKFGLK